MPVFEYVARDREGKQTNGVIAARDQAEVKEKLRKGEMYVTRLKQQATASQSSGLFSNKKVKLRDMVVASRQFATLVRAGLPIVECLHVIAEQSEHVLLKKTLDTVRIDIMSGGSLGTAMQKHPKVFSELYIALVSAGESGGFLEQTLDIAAEQFDKEAELRENVKAAFVYPVVVMITSVLVVAAMLIFVVPIFSNVYKQFHADLPPVTQGLVTLSFILLNYWWALFLGIAGVVMGARRYVATPTGRRNYDRLKLKLPLLGKLNRKIAISRFTETFGGTMRAGVPILQALTVAANTSGNIIFIEAIKKVSDFIKEGSSLSVPMEHTGEFPVMVTRMIAAGEVSGNLDQMLTEITHFYERDIRYTVQQLTRMMEPIMTVMVGSVVLVILIALYMPIFNLSQVLRK
jgi:type IV pilus assembly protein PilC